jgi:hypothetical protein
MTLYAGNWLQDFDEQTANLIIQLQIEDAERLSRFSKGKSREGQVSDAEIALQMYKQDLNTISSIISDRRMTQSIADAVQTDGPFLTETLLQEASDVRDREVARYLTENPGQPGLDNIESPPNPHLVDEEFLEKLSVLYVSGFNASQYDADQDAGDGGGPSSWTADKRGYSSQIDRRCEACRDDKKFFDVARLPCRHEYCRDCLEDLFRASLTDESLFPPRCCRQQIPIEAVRLFLKSKLVHAYEEKKIEFETPNRTYCSLPTCSAFIRAEQVTGEVGTCPVCNTRTCTVCKAVAHERGDCPKDSALQQVLETAAENGWQRCYSCWRIVELDLGCNHITWVSHSLFLLLSSADLEPAVAAVLNFAIFVDNAGRFVSVNSGMNIVSSLAPISL